MRRAFVAAFFAGLMLVGLAVPAFASPSGGSGDPLTDRQFVSWTSGGMTSQGHVYAAGLDWSRPVGLLVYVDGSGAYGFNHPSGTYLMAGTNGLVAVAKRQNMVLLMMVAPGAGCPESNCWYQTTSGFTPAQKAAWSASFVKQILSRYNIEQRRIALAGYSSGAQWLTEFFVPGGYADDFQQDGVTVAISYGGDPRVTANVTAAWKSAVHMTWNGGDADPSYRGADGVLEGYNWYRGHGFDTSLVTVAGEDHSRDGQFGAVVEHEIRVWVPVS